MIGGSLCGEDYGDLINLYEKIFLRLLERKFGCVNWREFRKHWRSRIFLKLLYDFQIYRICNISNLLLFQQRLALVKTALSIFHLLWFSFMTWSLVGKGLKNERNNMLFMGTSISILGKSKELILANQIHTI